MSAVVGDGRENCPWRFRMSKPHAIRTEKEVAEARIFHPTERLFVSFEVQSKTPLRKPEERLIILVNGLKRANYLVGRTSGAGAGAVSISRNLGSERRPGGFASPVQQQETVSSAKTEATRAARIRVMVTEVFRFWEIGKIPGGGRCRMVQDLLGWGDVSRMRGSRSGIWAAGNADESGSDSNEGEFHHLVEFVGWMPA